MMLDGRRILFVISLRSTNGDLVLFSINTKSAREIASITAKRPTIVVEDEPIELPDTEIVNASKSEAIAVASVMAPFISRCFFSRVIELH